MIRILFSWQKSLKSLETRILREYHKTTGRNVQSIKTGDVVLIPDDVPCSQNQVEDGSCKAIDKG